jgi:hypothetical protein
MIHNEHLRKADESYEIRHDNNGNAIHVYLTDGYAVLFPTIHDFIMKVYFGKQSESFTTFESRLEEIYESDIYDYYKIKENEKND